jgi:hypothetical protein
MPLLVNPGGKFVDLDDEQEVIEWLRQPGFREATAQEVAAYKQKRRDQALQMQKEAEEANSETSIFFATVPPGRSDGYGTAAKHLMEELIKKGMKIQTFQNRQKIGFLFHAPDSITMLDNPFKIVYTMFESDKIPPEWPEYLLEADKVLVPSKWCAEVFAMGGVNTEVVPLGYNDKLFTYKPRANKSLTHENFYFLHYNAFNLRKGFIEVFEAFKKAFDPSEPVRMIFKTTDLELKLPISPQNYPNIIIERGEVTPPQLVALMPPSRCICLSLPGRGFWGDAA